MNTENRTARKWTAQDLMTFDGYQQFVKAMKESHVFNHSYYAVVVIRLSLPGQPETQFYKLIQDGMSQADAERTAKAANDAIQRTGDEFPVESMAIVRNAILSPYEWEKATKKKHQAARRYAALMEEYGREMERARRHQSA